MVMIAQVAFGDPSLWLELMKANPDLPDVDLIKPGDELNVPESLVRLFKFRMAGLDTQFPNPVPTNNETAVLAKVVKADQYNWFTGVYPLVYAIVLGIICWVMWGLGSRRQARLNDEATSRRLKQEHEETRSRIRADPYSGPDQVEGGLPTAEAAAQHFAGQYHERRGNQTVSDSAEMPNRVTIERIEAIDVRGPMLIQYAGTDEPEERDIPDWTPAWQCFLSDKTSSISLMMCGNDVWFGTRTTPLSEDQIRPRQDMEPIEINQQVWPIVAEGDEAVNELEMLDAVEQFREVRFKGIHCVVVFYHDGREQETWTIPAPLAELIPFSLVNNQLIATIDGTPRVLGIITDQPQADSTKLPDTDVETVPTYETAGD